MIRTTSFVLVFLFCIACGDQKDFAVKPTVQAQNNLTGDTETPATSTTPQYQTGNTPAITDLGENYIPPSTGNSDSGLGGALSGLFSNIGNSNNGNSGGGLFSNIGNNNNSGGGLFGGGKIFDGSGIGNGGGLFGGGKIFDGSGLFNNKCGC